MTSMKKYDKELTFEELMNVCGGNNETQDETITEALNVK